MDAVIVYESMFGNTRKVAEAIAAGVRGADPEAQVMLVRAAGEAPGPLREGELDRARAWGAALAAQPTPAPVA